MTVFLVRRLMQSVVVLCVMSIIVFAGVYAIGNPVDILISPEADQFERERAIAALGLDKPMWVQYLTFLGNVFQGDLGRSFVFNEPAIRLIFERLPATLELALTATLPVGDLSACRSACGPASSRIHISGRGIMAGSILGFSLPNFWQGLMLIMVFAVMLLAAIRPPRGRGDTVRHHLQRLDPGRPVASDPAGDQSGAGQHVADHPPDPRRHARGTAAGLCEVRPRQGADPAPGGVRPRAEEHPDPAGHGRSAWRSAP